MQPFGSLLLVLLVVVSFSIYLSFETVLTVLLYGGSFQRLPPSAIAAALAGDLSMVDKAQQPQGEGEEEVHRRPASPPYDLPGFTREDLYK